MQLLVTKNYFARDATFGSCWPTCFSIHSIVDIYSPFQTIKQTALSQLVQYLFHMSVSSAKKRDSVLVDGRHSHRCQLSSRKNHLRTWLERDSSNQRSILLHFTTVTGVDFNALQQYSIKLHYTDLSEILSQTRCLRDKSNINPFDGVKAKHTHTHTQRRLGRLSLWRLGTLGNYSFHSWINASVDGGICPHKTMQKIIT